jgi:hypothetical protein
MPVQRRPAGYVSRTIVPSEGGLRHPSAHRQLSKARLLRRGGSGGNGRQRWFGGPFDHVRNVTICCKRGHTAILHHTS